MPWYCGSGLDLVVTSRNLDFRLQRCLATFENTLARQVMGKNSALLGVASREQVVRETLGAKLAAKRLNVVQGCSDS
jgi:hypothetical protein